MTAERILIIEDERAVARGIELGAVLQAEQPARVAIWVQDNGAGIAPQDLPHVFERFYRGSIPPRPGRESGSGLGLAIVQSIVQAHGGQAVAESQPGQGSRFTLLLPGEIGKSPTVS